ncbi:MAG: hypothetical protein ACLUI3_15135 [Christensenellales bacterium]
MAWAAPSRPLMRSWASRRAHPDTTVFAVDHVLDICPVLSVSWFLTAGTLFVCYLYVQKLMRTVSAAPAAA